MTDPYSCQDSKTFSCLQAQCIVQHIDLTTSTQQMVWWLVAQADKKKLINIRLCWQTQQQQQQKQNRCEL
jgi:hypothetical protein